MSKERKACNTSDIIHFEDVITKENIYRSYKRIRKGKRLRTYPIYYHIDLSHRLYKLRQNLESGSYKMRKVYAFTVYEPKEREVVSDYFEDKIVQDILSKQVLYPTIQPKLIYDNYATQPNKGTHLALHRLQKFMIDFAKNQNWDGSGWVLAGDIKKFFYSIDQDICEKQINDLPIDEKLKKLIIEQVHMCTPELNPYRKEPGKGLCIGFQPSQWLSIYYLNSFDHFVKETLHIRYYGRYMDDFFIIHEDKEYLKYCLEKIRDYLWSNLKLELNKKTYIHPFSQGICFLGYHVTYNVNTHQIDTDIRRKSINKVMRRGKKHVKRIKDGKMKLNDAVASLNSWSAYADHGMNEKAANAREKLWNMIMSPDNILAKYREMCKDWSNLDDQGFFRLKVREDIVLRDIDGFAILIPRKRTKQEAWFRDMQLRVWSDPQKYIQSNFAELLRWSKYGPDYKEKRKKKQQKIANSKKNKAKRKLRAIKSELFNDYCEEV